MKKFFTLIAVAAMAFAAQANTLVVCDAGYDGYQSAVAPIYGLWVDTEGTMAQMIYTADMLQDMVGCEITEVKFTTTAYWYENFGDISNASSTSYINFDDATIQLSFLGVEGGFEGMAFYGATPVATTVPVRGEDNMTFVLDEPFVYEGGDLMIECKVIEPGSYGTTYFFGTGFAEDVQCCYYGYESYSGWVSSFMSFLPMVTFEYDDEDVPPIPSYEAPVITWTAENGVLEITASGEGPVMMIIDGEISRTGVDEVTYYMQYDPAEGVTVNVEAYIHVASEPVSDITTETIVIEPVTPPVEPTEKTGAPTFHGYTEDGIHAYFVEIIPTEPSVIYYRIQYPDGTWTEWAEYEEILSFTGDGKYRVEAYAIADGKLKSEDIAYEFVVAPLTGIAEMVSGKTVAGVRYYNMAGQEMQQADGLTIVVTTYTDGTTSAVKVVK